MRVSILLSLFAILLLSNSDCKKKKSDKDAVTNESKTEQAKTDGRFTGRLEVAGICKNYTVSVIEGDMDKKLVESEWTDPSTQKKYTNAFRLGNPCDFPATIKAGDTFHFVLDTAPSKDCIVCMAYYPTPSKALSIKVVE